MNKTKLLNLILLFVTLQTLTFCQNLVDIIKFGTKEKKLAEIKNIKHLSKKDLEFVFNTIVEEKDPDLSAELIQNLPDILPVEEVLPRILELLSYPQLQQHSLFTNAVKNYIDCHKNLVFTYSYIKDLILSPTTDLYLKSCLIKFLNIFPYEKVFPIINQVYTKQDIIRVAVATLLSSYSDIKTKEILIHYLSDEIPEVVAETVRSLIIRKEWDVLPLVVPLVKHKFCGKEIKQMLYNIDDISADKHFFSCLSLFETDPELYELCLVLSAKHKNVEFLPVYIELYKKTKNLQIKQTLHNVIQNYTVPNTEHIFIAQLNNKELRDVVVPLLIKLQAKSSIPYLLNIYPHVSEELQVQIENFVTTVTDDSLVYHFLTLSKIPNLPLRCLILKTLVLYDNPAVYSYIEQEINSTKNKQILTTIISSVGKVKIHDKKIIFIKLLFTKCYRDNDLLYQLLTETEKIVKTSEEKFVLLLPELVKTLSHPQGYISDKSFEILQVIIPKSTVEEVRIVYDLIQGLPDEKKIAIINLLLQKLDYELLPVITNMFYKTKNVQLKQKICEYILNLTGSVSNQVIIDSLHSNNQELQLYVLNLLQGKINYSDIHFFLPLCNSKNKNVRLSTAKLISEMLTQKERNYILNFLSDDVVEIKIIGIKSMAKVLPEEFLSLVAKLLSSPNDEVRIATLEQLINIPTTNLKVENIKHLITNIAQRDKSLQVRALAVTLLANWKECTTETVKIYFDAINSYDTKLRSAAEYAFNQILPICNNTEDIFIKGLITDNTRTFFVKKVIELKPKSDKIKHTIKSFILTTKDVEKQKLYLTALSELLQQEDTSILKELYETDNFVLQLWVVEQLTKFALDEKIEQLLLTALTSQQTSIRQKAVETAKKFLRSKKIHDAIVYISVNDTNYSIRSLATKIIKELQK